MTAHRDSNPQQWTLSSAQALTALQQGSQIPLPGSPLRHLAAQKPQGEEQPPAGGGFQAAWRRILRPDYVLIIAPFPAEDRPVTTLYARAGDPRYARYATEGEAHQIEWPLVADRLADNLAALLQVDAGGTPLPTSLTLGRSGYEAFLALVDAVREESLRATLDRRQLGPIALTAEALRQCFRRSIKKSDMRWLAVSGAAMAPAPLKPTIAGLESGLQQLADQTLVVREGHAFTPTSHLIQLGERLTGGTRFVTLQGRRRAYDADGQIVWHVTHRAIMMGTGGHWLLAFQTGPAGAFEVTISSVGPAGVRQAMDAVLNPPRERPRRTAPPEAAEPASDPSPPPATDAPPAPRRKATAAEAEIQQTVVQPAQTRSDWYLIAERGEQQGSRFDIVEQLRIGREADCHVRLVADTVSRYHALLLLGSRGLLLRDMGSTNGTFVNGLKLSGDMLLQPGDIVDVGDTRLRVAGPETAVRTAPLPPEPADPPPPTVIGPGPATAYAYVPPPRPAGQPDPAYVPPPETPPAPAPEAPSARLPAPRRRRGCVIALILATLLLGVLLITLVALYAAGIFTPF